MSKMQPDYKRTGITYAPSGEQEWRAMFECPTDDCMAQHEFAPEKTKCTSCGALIEPQIVARVVKPSDSERAASRDSEDNASSNLGGFDEPFSVPDRFAEQTIV